MHLSQMPPSLGTAQELSACGLPQMPQPAMELEMNINTIFAKSKLNENTGCWHWQGAKNHQGYGLFKQNNAHRIAYMSFHKLAKVGGDVSHLCPNRDCVNPQHLKAVPHAKNMEVLRRSVRSGRPLKNGVRCIVGAKLPYDLSAWIREYAIASNKRISFIIVDALQEFKKAKT